MALKSKFFITLYLLVLSSVVAQVDFKNLERQADLLTNTKDQVKAYLDISWEYFLIENDSSLYFSEKAYQIAEENDDPFGKVISLESQGLYYDSVENDYEKATSLYLEAIKISDKHDLDYSSSLYISLGIIFEMTEDHQTAARYFKESIDLSRKAKDLDVLKYGLVNYGTALSQLNRLEEAEQAYLECISLKVVNVEADLSCYSNLANIYDRRGDYETAHLYHKKSLDFPDDENITIRYLPHYSATLQNNIARKDETGMDSLVEKLYEFADKGSSLRHRVGAYDAIANAHLYRKEFEKAALASQKSKTLSDSLYTKSLKETTYELERKYENQKNRQQLDKERKIQKLYVIVLIVLASFLLLLGYFFYKRNLTNKTLSQQKTLLEKTIDQKNLLLKETHHRVKNSFQMVSSLLYIQGETTDQIDAQMAIKEAQNRVRSMVLTHQKLYNTDDLVGIDTQEYITDLTQDVVDSYNLENDITCKVQAEKHILNIDTITPLGIILNELLTNCFKHAFTAHPSNDKKIEVRFKKEEDQFLLEVCDNGIGISNDRRDGALGLELLESLAQKLNGDFEIQPRKEGGTKATVRFKVYQLSSTID